MWKFGERCWSVGEEGEMWRSVEKCVGVWGSVERGESTGRDVGECGER